MANSIESVTAARGLTPKSKPRALIICAQAPSRTASQAGHKTAYEFIAEYARQYAIDLVLLVNASEHIDRNIGNELGLNEVAIHPFSRLDKAFAVIAALPFLPPRYATRFSWHVVRRLRNMVENNDYSLIVCEFSQAGPYIRFVNSKAKSRLSMADVQAQVVFRATAAESLLFSGYTYRFESKLFQQFDELVVQCQKDKDLLTGLYSARNVIVKPPVLSDFVYSIKRDPARCERHSMMYWGAMNRSENEDAAMFLIENVMPKLVRQIPDAKLYVVGNKPSARLLACTGKNVVVTGFVADPTEIFEKVRVGVVPLRKGAGIKVKTLEMLKAGIPVISSPVGAEGVELGEKLTVVNCDAFLDELTTFFLEKAGELL